MRGRQLLLATFLALSASPLNLLLLRADALPGPVPLMLVVALDVVATMALGRVMGSLSAATLTVSALNLPLLLSLGLPESGAWAAALAAPKYAVQAALAWKGWATTTTGRVRWTSILLSTAGLLTAMGSWLL
jgi:hypothetical protein